jgi:tetratricopeptide (TPR) repeat protein
VLADPSNVATTLRFAELAVLLGDLDAAIGAYERALHDDPGLVPVYVELGALHLRLGAYSEARAYLDAALDSPDLTDELRLRVISYIAEIDRTFLAYQFSFYLHGGLRYQSNASAGPRTSAVRTQGENVVLGSIFAQKPDANWFSLAAGSYIYEFHNQRSDTIEANFLTYYAHQFRLQRLNVGALELQIGPRFGVSPEYADGGSIRYYGIVNGVMLGDRPYFSTWGGGISTRYEPAPGAIVEGQVEFRNRRFYDSIHYPTASEQSGKLLSSGVRLSGNIDDRVGWAASGVYEHNHADMAHHSYRGLSLDIAFPIVFEMAIAGATREWVFTPYGGYSYTSYGAPDPTIDPMITRADRDWRVGASVDARFSQKSWVRLDVHFSDRTSNLVNFTMRNLSVSLGPAMRF